MFINSAIFHFSHLSGFSVKFCMKLYKFSQQVEFSWSVRTPRHLLGPYV